MEGILVYNGLGDPDEWFKALFRTNAYIYYPNSTSIDSCGPIRDSSKPYFKVGGPKLLIRW